MAQPLHVGAALQVFDQQFNACSDVLILGRGPDGRLMMLASSPEGDKAPLTRLVVEALAHLGLPGEGLYAGREWIVQQIADDAFKARNEPAAK